MGSRPKQRPSLLGLSARTASRSERFEANRRRRLLGRDRAPPRRPCGLPYGRGVKGSIRLAPDQTDRRRAPSSGLLGWRRSAAYAATTLRAASRARGQRPLPVCPTPASWEARPDRAQSSGVLRHSLGRADRAGLDKKQVEAGTDMRVPSTQPKAGTLPGDT